MAHPFSIKKRAALLVSGLLLLATTACTTLLNASIPQEGYTLVRNVAYGDQPRQTLDIYTPTGHEKPRGVLLFFYGGSWQMGAKEDYRFVGEAFASTGYITVIADYRVYPEVYFPQFVEDGARAVVWLHGHIAQYGGDANRLFVSGHSAGAHIAAMLALDDRYITRAGGSPDWIRGTLGIAGPYDFLPLTDAKLIALFSKQPIAQTQPITFATHKTAPIFLATGDADDTVAPKNSYHLAEKLKAQHSLVDLRTYPDVGHIGIVLALAQGFRNKAPLLEDMVAFMDAAR
ncbi:MAG: alpha/beta hydrolase [Pseudomonadota bacterium]